LDATIPALVAAGRSTRDVVWKRVRRRHLTEGLQRRPNPCAWDGDYEIQTAKKLEQRFPEEILKYYLSGLGNLRTNAVRKEYARRAQVMAKVRRLLVVKMKDKDRWHSFAVR
jgi:hypothetical protein